MKGTIEYIKSKTGNFNPEIAIILGSGLGELADEYCDIKLAYKDIPNFPVSTVKGHSGNLVFAEIGGKKVMMMQGRFHYYEGHSMSTVTYPVKVMKKLGVKTVIITNAAGGVNPYFKPSSLMIIKDHINFMGTNPLIGPNDDNLGDRFPDMSEVYTKSLRETARNCASRLNIPVEEGVYIALTGPAYETPAEVNMVRTLGADAVGMSTVPEAITACYLKMNVLGISCICNSAAGISTVGLSHKEVLEAADKAKTGFKKLVLEIIKEG
ncbi:MAG: purine-nucleoside phosphorylase [Candidatus Gastranaerophilales bacterium]|nr:purine-nucleoside phosphorylase [Candidatus Gastranaerophilales bacterium]